MRLWNRRGFAPWKTDFEKKKKRKEEKATVLQSIQDILGIEYLRQPFPQKNLKEYCTFCMIKGLLKAISRTLICGNVYAADKQWVKSIIRSGQHTWPSAEHNFEHKLILLKKWCVTRLWSQSWIEPSQLWKTMYLAPQKVSTFVSVPWMDHFLFIVNGVD